MHFITSNIVNDCDKLVYFVSTLIQKSSSFSPALNNPTWYFEISFLWFRACFGKCKEIGCAGETCFAHCNTPLNGSSSDDNWYLKVPLYLWLKQENCLNDCQYHCMLQRENVRATRGLGPVKYHGKWPFKRVFGLQVC